ncbi:COG4223 family protein [Pseudotabrizicola algicola]|uniref:Mitochondrial inner membrane protein n=1 Tax=Pseudotabrizicola algicola TaxID=2709381 RepID=A0A6B3RRL9_9RHOB|nr:hypothetical protein [Pseudotabrizicola algicola]NEX48131.1 hypothetical protein [Pseudotabrizicola algicola]
MAKRPPSSAKPAEEEVGGSAAATPIVESVENATIEPSQTEEVAPIVIEEPPRPDAEIEPPVAAESGGVSEGGDNPAGQMEQSVPVAEDTATKPANDSPRDPLPNQQASQRSNGFLGTALGGVVAAAAGYALAVFVPFPGIGTSDTQTQSTEAQIAELAARIETLEAAPDVIARLSSRITDLEARPVAEPAVGPEVSDLAARLAEVENKIASAEDQGTFLVGDANAADLIGAVESLRAEVAQLQASGADANAGIETLAAQTEARLAEAEAQAAALRAEAERTAQRAVVAAALGRVQAALESGAPFAGALADIPDAQIPAELAALAESGVPSRALLQDAYPPAAREALEASLKANMGESWSDRVASFLQTSTGARSLVPREGNDPDAVLSRAEAAVKAGDIAQALAELENLPPEGQARMADWSALARQRLEAIAAVSALSAGVEG